MTIHPSALVSPNAEIHETASIGPFSIVGAGVKIGAHCDIQGHATIENRTFLNEGVTVHPYARIGGIPQDLKYQGEPGELHIGANTTIRESATINIGTEHGGMKTIIGDDCLIMAYVHIGHDCRIDKNVVIVNSVSVAGHVHIQSGAIIGGLAGVHQFVNIGPQAFVAAGAMVARDVLPYATVQGDRAKHIGLNLVGLKRAGWKRDAIRVMRDLFRDVQSSSHPLRTVVESHLEKHPANKEIQSWKLALESTRRGIASFATVDNLSDEL